MTFAVTGYLQDEQYNYTIVSHIVTDQLTQRTDSDRPIVTTSNVVEEHEPLYSAMHRVAVL